MGDNMIQSRTVSKLNISRSQPQQRQNELLNIQGLRGDDFSDWSHALPFLLYVVQATIKTSSIHDMSMEILLHKPPWFFLFDAYSTLYTD